ncbi:M20 metallopeptidase family protein [Actinoplanes couchii]|uniref:Hydrolase n=1 Tax=Actinoplanes couchii TaxID=403638 RepID=A0ABQ3XRB4_9ACTN|nr:M20/M25/M40 family metallo-hydrolase [Actinoplanes couchii]MDR6320012.1 metal-dependent amidase/aminoacylase/carboxypeptidase family protein [Actinoplanes couchii]GID61051.1 hydrolase [Actinoplanes couchii]
MTNLDEELIALRRAIHRDPELAGAERQTAGLVAEQMRAAGLEVTTGVGGHGVLAVLDGSVDGPTLVYRADMDAVDTAHAVHPYPHSGRIFDDGFASRAPGAAHLCGHDLHTAIGVGVARFLARGPVRGRVAFVFQPAEEPLRGARAMLDTGLVQRLAPAESYALHCAPFPVGTLAVSPGLGLPGIDHARIEFPDGRTADFTTLSTVEYPADTVDYQARFRALLETEPRDSVSVSQWTAGSVTNVLSRVWPQEQFPALRTRIQQLASRAGGQVEFPADPFPAMVNTPDLSTRAGEFLSTVLGDDAVLWARASWPYNCEDFALFLKEAPGAMFYLGVANPETGMNGSPHTVDFAADERAIGHGVRAMSALLTHRLSV